MNKSQTLDGLSDTLSDLAKQLEKAEEKYMTLRSRADAVQQAIQMLAGPEGEAPRDPDAEAAEYESLDGE